MSVLSDLKAKSDSISERLNSLAQEAVNLKGDHDALGAAIEAEVNRVPTLQDVVDLVARVPKA